MVETKGGKLRETFCRKSRLLMVKRYYGHKQIYDMSGIAKEAVYQADLKDLQEPDTALTA